MRRWPRCGLPMCGLCGGYRGGAAAAFQPLRLLRPLPLRPAAVRALPFASRCDGVMPHAVSAGGDAAPDEHPCPVGNRSLLAERQRDVIAVDDCRNLEAPPEALHVAPQSVDLDIATARVLDGRDPALRRPIRAATSDWVSFLRARAFSS